jgi:hypothetical protein
MLPLLHFLYYLIFSISLSLRFSLLLSSPFLYFFAFLLISLFICYLASPTLSFLPSLLFF